MAAEVGAAGLVCGIDISEPMLALARARTLEPGSAPVELRQADANRLPYAVASFDAAVSTQVLEYVRDVAGALDEIWRVLRPGGRVLVLDTDWDSIVWRSGDDRRAGARRLPGRATPGGAVVQRRLRPGHLQRRAAGDRRRLRRRPRRVGRRGGRGVAADLRGLGDGYFFSLNRYLFCATKPA